MSAGGKKKPGRKTHAGLRAQRTAIALEPRIMFDAAAAATIATVAEHTHTHAHNGAHNALLDAAAHGPGTGDWHHNDTKAASVTDVVFIDSAVPDIQTLIAGIKPGEQVFVLDPNQDGIQQIADILAANHLTNLSGIQIVGHGAQGEIQLGSTVLNDAGLAGEAPALARIGAALATGGDLALYSCDTAEGAQGAQFIADLSGYAGGVDVAASTHDIGSADLGANWTLDAATGALPARAPFTAQALSQFQGELGFVSPTPINNDQPSLVLTQLVVTTGIFPGHSGSSTADPGGIPLGAIRTFAESSTALPSPTASGQLVSIGQNTALFSLLGYTYGTTNTQQNFGLPDLRGTTLIGAGQGSGLSDFTVGQKVGTDSVTLNSLQMPTSIGGSGATFDDHAPSLAVTYLINAGGSGTGVDLPGAIIPFAGNFVPDGYLAANGQVLNISDYPALYAAIGITYGGNGTTTFALPDLQGRVAVGASSVDPLGTEYGSEGTAITTNDLPAGAGGFNLSVNNDAPSLAVNYIIATTGAFPTNSGGLIQTQYLGEILAYAGKNIPTGWVLASGQTLQIVDNNALFQAIGTTYGGDGVNTFDLPNLSGDAGFASSGSDVVSAGTEPSIGTNFTLGETYGSDSISLTSSNILDALPTFQNFAATASSTEQVSGILEGSLTVTDVNLVHANYDGTSLTISRDGGANTDDGFGFDTSGALFTVSGSNLQSGGNTFGTFTDTGGTLAVNFQQGGGGGAVPSQALVNDVLQHVTYADQSHEPPSSVTLDITFSDGNSGVQGHGDEPGTVAAKVTVDITPTNPVIDSAATASVNEGVAAGSPVYTTVARDPFAGPLTYSLTGTDANDFTIDATTGVVAISAVPTFESKPSYAFNITATDSGGTSDTKAITLNVNDLPPVISSGTAASVLERAAAGTVVYTAIAADPGGDTVSYSLTGTDASAFTINPNTGIVTINAVPNFEAKSSYSFSVEASDPSGMFNTQAVTLSVVNVNDAPSGADKTITTLEDTPYIFAAADFGFSDSNDSPANNLLAVKIDTLPSGGTLTDNGVAVVAGQSVSAFDISVNRLVYTPAANANGNGAASFTFQVQDDGGTANGGVDTDPTHHAITFNVTPVNDPPSGADKTVSLAEGGSYTFTANDFGFTDPNDNPANTLLAVKITSLPDAGVLKDNGVTVTAGQSIAVADITGNKLVFTPTANANGSPYTTLTFQVRDNGGTANGGIDTDPTPNTITFDVTPVNHAPVASADSYTLITGNTLTIPAAAGVLANDTDADGDTLSAVLGTTTAHGTLTLNADGSFSYTPTAGYTGGDSFTYQAKDPSGALSAATTVSLTVGAAANSTGQLFYEINSGADAGIYSINPDGSSRALIVDPAASFLDIAVDTSAHLLFVTGGANYIRVYNTTTGALLTTETFGTLATDEISSLAIDPATHTLFVGDFGPDASTIGIRQLSYNTSTGALTPISTNNGFLFTAAQTETGGNAATTKITNPMDMVLDTTNHLLYYADNDSDASGFTATNQVYVVDYTAANPLPVQLTSSTQFPANNSNGFIDSIAVDSAKGLVYFLTDGTPNSSENALWYVSTSGGANQTAQAVSLGTGVTLADPGDVAGLTLDPVTQQLYITNTTDTDGNVGNILVTQLSADGHSASLVRTLGEATLSADTSSLDTPGPTYFNDVPVLTLDNSATYTEGTAQALSPNLTVSDPGGGALDGATVTISGGFLTGDVLAATTTGTSISASFNAGTHVLTLSGDDSLAHYQSVLRSVTFNSTSDAPTNGTATGSRTLQWTVSDGSTLSAGTVTSFLTVDAVNDAPVNHVPGAQSVNEDTALVFSGGTAITISDADVGSGNESVTLSAVHGTLTLGSTTSLVSWNGNGTSSVTAVGTVTNINAALSGLSYQGVLNFNGADTITVTTNDNGNTGLGGAQQAISTIAVTVNPVNDAPVATADSYTASENATLAVSAVHGVLANDSDVDGDPITAILSSNVSHGALTLNPDGSFNYTPTTGYTGLDSFTYKANDGLLNSNIVTVTLTVQQQTLAAANDSYVTNEDTSLLVGAGQGLLANDSGASLSVTAVNGLAVIGSQITLTSGAHLTVNADGSFDYVPAANANGPDSFSYTVSDGSSSATATVAISVTSVNDAPLGADKTVTTLEDTAYVFTASDFGFSDPSDNPANSLLAVKIDTLPAAGTLTDNGVSVTAGQFVPVADISAGLLVFTPGANANGAGYASLSFQLQDNGGTANGGVDTSVSANTITVDVTSVNDAPLGADKTVTTLEDTAYVFTASDFGFSDPSDNPANSLLAVKIDTLPAAGTLTDNGVSVTAGQFVPVADISAGLLVFTPGANANGAGYASLSFQLQDNGGTANGGVDTSVSANTITVDVTSVNDAPLGADKTVTTLEDTAYVFTASDFGFSDPSDNPANSLLAVKIDTLPAAGTLTDNGVSVTAGQFVPVADISAGLLVFTPGANANGAGYASLSFQLQDNGGTANGGVDTSVSANTITVDVTSVNDAPLGADKTVTTLEDTAYVFTASDFGFSDPSDNPANSLLAVKIDTLPAAGTLTDNGVSVTAGQFVPVADISAGLLVFTPGANANGAGYASLSFQLQDNGGTANGGVDTSVSANTITVDVTSVNDAPLGADKTVTTLEDTAYVFTASDFGFSDPSDNPANSLLAVKIDTLPAAGTLTDNGVSVTAGQFVPVADISAGLLVFTPGANANGAGYASLSFQLQDNGGTANGGVDTSVSANTITVDVTSVNDAPLGADKTVTTLEDTAYVFTASDFGFSDPSDNPANSLLAVKIDTLPAAGTLTDNGVSVTAGQFVPVADISAGLLVFTPGANANGAGYASLSFQLQDNGGTANGGVDTSVSANTITVDVTSVNDAPLGADKTVTTLEDTAYVFTASDFGFSDPSDNPANSLLAVKIDTLPAAGTLTDNGVSVTAGQFVPVADISAGLLVFTPGANANGAGYASLSFQLQDNGGTANGGVDTSVSANTITVDVTSVNDAPLGADKTVTTLEDTAYVFTASDFGFSDPSDNPANSLLAVKIDTLPAAGTLTDNGVSVTAGQFVPVADISAGLLVFTPGANANGAGYASLSFQLQDNGGTANGGVDTSVSANTITVDVTSVNDAPLGADKTVTTLEDTAYVFTASDFGFSDPSDNPANSLLAVKIDTLPAAGTLTDNGVSVTAGQFVPVADISAGLLVFTPGANANGAGYASLSFQLQDNGGTANGGVDTSVSANTITVDVTSVNDAPLGADKTVTTLEDTAYVFTASDFGFSDPSDNPANSLLAVKIDTLPAAGTLTDNGVSVTAGQFVPVADISAGLLVFTPGANANGAGYASLSFQLQDNGGTANGGVDTSVSANTITVDVTSVNDAPLGADKTVTTLEDTAYVFTASDFGFSDPSDNPANSLLAVKIDTLPAAGTLTDNGVSVTAGQFVPVADISAGLLVFTPGANANGAGYASLSFQLQDNGGTANGGVDTSVSANTITVDVTSVNDAPLGADKTVTTLEDTAYVFTASDFGFSDPSDNPANSLLAVKIDTLPAAGTLTDNGVSVTAGQFVPVADISAGLLVFTPGANANGAGYASLSFQLQDNGGTANGGVDTSVSANTITVDVTSVNDAPLGADKTVTTLEDTAYVFTASDFGFSDPSDNPANSLLAVKIDTLPAAGTLTDNGVSVTAGQFVPVADISAGLLVFTPGANANGAGYASLSFQLQDNGGTANGGVDTSVSANTITVDVTSVNDAPLGADKTVTTLEDTAYVFTASDFGFSDPSDNPANSLLAVKIDTLPAAGTLTDNGVSVTAGQFVPVADISAGLLVFTPGANANGAGYASLSFQLQDNGGTANGGVDTSVSANTITVDVTSVNDAPLGADKTVTTLEDTAYVFTASDFGFSDPSDNPANSLLAVKIDTLPAAGTLTDNGVSVTAGQFVPVADISAGLLVFTPGANANGAGYASLSFQLQDNGGTANGGVDTSVSANTITVDVTSVNDAPLGADKTVTTLEDTAYVFTASDFGFSDPSDNPANSLLAVKIDTLPAAGTLTDNGVSVTAGQFVPVADISAGLLVFTPGANANGAGYASLSFQLQDNGGTANGGVDTSVSANTITVDVTSVNDAPLGADKTVTTLEDTAYVFTASDFGFSDPSDNPANSLLAVKIDTLPAAGTLTDNGVSVTAGQFVPVADISAGLLVFTPGANANGAGYASLSFQLQDNGGTANGGVDTSVSANTITVDVTPVNDPPVATDQTVSLTDAQAGDPYSFQLPNNLFFDVDGDTLTLSAQNLPDGLSFDAASRTISGTPSSRGVGTDTIILTATDPSNTSAQRNLSLVVKPLTTTPFASNPNTPDNQAGSGDTGTGGTGGTGDTGGAPSGTGTDTGTTVEFSDTNTYTSGEPAYIHLDTSSTGGGGLFVLPGHVSHQGTFHADPAGQMVFTLPDGTFSSNDPGLSANALMGDGQPLPGWLSFDAANGTFAITGPIPPGAHDITVEVVGHTKDGQTLIMKFHLSLPRQHAALTPVQRVHLASGQRAAGIGKAPVSHLIKAASNEARLSHRNGLIADLAVLFAPAIKQTKKKSPGGRDSRA